MSSSPVVSTPSLPRDIDVQINITRPQTELATDMSLLVFCTPDVATLPPNNGRVILASTAQGILDATGWGPTDTGYWAVQAWAQQSPRPLRMAVGRVFAEPVLAQLMAAAITNYSALSTIADGSFIVTVVNDAGVPAVLSVEGIDLQSANTTQAIVSAINTAIVAGSQEGELAAVYEYGRIVLNARGTNVSISYAEPGTAGTDVSTLLNLTQAVGAQKWDAYTPAGLVSEISLIQQALSAASAPAFVVALDAQYRDTPEQKLVADYVQANLWKMAGTFCTNSPTAYNSADTTNIAYYIDQLMNYQSCSAVYSSFPQQYPEIAYVQSMLSTDYAGSNTVKTAKFKTAAGITPEPITETQLQVLDSRRCNIYTRSGNNSEFFREGYQGADTWWTDSYYGWANLREEAQVAVFNGLIRRGNTPMTTPGVTLLQGDLAVVFDQYITNGFLAEREENVPYLNNPYVTRKAYTITPQPIWTADRGTRTAPSIAVVAYEAGSIHKAIINIDAVN